MARYCLKDRKIHEIYEEASAGFEPAAIFHLDADGGIEQVTQLPALTDGEGMLLVSCEAKDLEKFRKTNGAILQRRPELYGFACEKTSS